MTAGTIAPVSAATVAKTAVIPDPINDFSVDNIGLGNQALSSVPHFSVQNIGQTTTPNASIVLIPASTLSNLSTGVRQHLQNMLASGTSVVLAWQDTSSPVSKASVGAALNVPVLGMGSNKTLGSIYATGVARLGSGKLALMTFVTTQPITRQLETEAIWSGVNSLPLGPWKGPQANGSDPNYTAYNLFTFGTNGEISVWDQLNMTRVNNNTLSVWSDHQPDVKIMPGSELYASGQTQFNGDMNTYEVVTDYSQGKSSEPVVSEGPNSTDPDQTASVSLGADGVGYSWTFGTAAVTWLNQSTTTDAKWELDFQWNTNSSMDTYDAYPGWQMTNTSGSFEYWQNLMVEWTNWWSGYPTSPVYTGASVTEPDW